MGCVPSSPPPSSRRRPRAMRASARHGSASRTPLSPATWATCADPNARADASAERPRVIREHQRHARRELGGVADVQELVRTMRVGMWPEYASYEELSAREALAQHPHERDRPATAGVHGIPAEDRA